MCVRTCVPVGVSGLVCVGAGKCDRACVGVGDVRGPLRTPALGLSRAGDPRPGATRLPESGPPGSRGVGDCRAEEARAPRAVSGAARRGASEAEKQYD